jgi:hypothetical protein
MRRLLRLPLVLLALQAGGARAEASFAVAPSAGVAWIANRHGFGHALAGRLEAAWRPFPELALGAFGTVYSPFPAGSGDSSAHVDLSGWGPTLTATWPLRPDLQPYLRVEWLIWHISASGYGRSLSSADGSGPGLGAGLRFALGPRAGLCLEASGYRRISGGDVRQIGVGASLAF